MTVAAGGESVDLIALNMGNPQAIILGALPDDERFHRIGAALERHPSFPEGTNVIQDFRPTAATTAAAKK